MKNKRPKLDEEKKFRIFFFLILTLVILYTVLQFATAKDRTVCPYIVEGNPDADFVIKYVDSPYCTWCWFEEPILDNLVKEKGKSFRLEKYDIRHCRDVVNKYQVPGTPFFVFSTENGTKEYSQMGFINKENLNKIICEVTGDC